MYMGMHLIRAVKLFPERTAIVDGDLRFTYAQFNERVNRLAHGLSKRGLKKGDRVALLMPNCHQAVESDAVCYKTGLVKVPLNTRLSIPELVHQMNNSEAHALIVHPLFIEEIERHRADIQTIEHYIAVSSTPGSMIDYEKVLAEGSPDEPQADVELDDLYSLNYTSGTSGVLKAAMLTHRNFLSLIRQSLLGTGMYPDYKPVTAYVAPVTHAAGGMLLPTFIKGGTQVLLNVFDLDLLFKTIEQERVTDILLIPVMINFMLAFPEIKKYDYSSLRYIIYGTAPMAPERIRQALEIFGPILRQGYGQTESTAVASWLGPEDHVTNGDPVREKRLGSAGLPCFEAEVRVVDEEGKDVPTGEVGEIILHGDFVIAGYWKDPELTADTIKNGWLYTRDMGAFDEAGYLYLIDRKSDMIISGGFNIYPNEVENTLYEHPAVFEAAVVGVPDDEWGEAVKAVVVLKPGAEATEAEMIEHCKTRLASYKKPKSVEFVQEIPKNPIGKVLRRLVREPFWKGHGRRVN
ncbi:MAG: long-chain fatty acid--CoA ligase [Proteobacteria bacterium]|nr:long-chain fatty acid--CoA ligase [Pseudomonadota bacterium]